MKAVRYDRFGGIGQLYVADVPEPAPGPGEVLVRVEAGALNPGALPALDGSSYTPGRDLAGDVVAAGEGVLSFAAGDAVLGWLQSWEAHAQLVAIPATQLVKKPEGLSWDVGGSLYTTPMAGLGAIKAVEPRPGETVVISGASGGVGFTAAQLAVRAGATVIGLTSAGRFDLLRRYGIEPVQYGEGEEERIRAAAGQHRVHAFIDAVGGGYIDLALALNVPRERTDTVVDYRGAQEKGVKALGTTDAGGLPALSELADLAGSGDLHIPIAATYPLTAVQDAYRALANRKAHGRIVLHPQDLTLSPAHDPTPAPHPNAAKASAVDPVKGLGYAHLPRGACLRRRDLGQSGWLSPYSPSRGEGSYSQPGGSHQRSLYVARSPVACAQVAADKRGEPGMAAGRG